MKKTYLIAIIIAIVIISIIVINNHSNMTRIKASTQRIGDAKAGYDYLLNGDYVSSGIPSSFFNIFADSTSILLGREKQNHNLPPQFTRIENNSVEMIAPNCLSCHGDYLNGKYIIGLGNSSFNYTLNLNAATNLLSLAVKGKYGLESSEWHAYEPFDKATKAINPRITTETRGVNPADKLTAVLVAHRDPQSLEWQDTAALDIPEITIPTDVPPWWVFKKKNAMFYTAIGRGDFSKFLMASSILTLKDTSEAKLIDEKFPDVLSWINTIEPPPFPKDIDGNLASEGKVVFTKYCSGCHGGYDDEDDYPNFLVSQRLVGTDPALSDAYNKGHYLPFVNWYNKSWFSNSENPGKLIIEDGYVAQPLDGIWASAPYLHNGSVPTVESLLNSKLRPKYWKRSYDSYDYNYDALGWNYEELTDKKDNETYDTTIYGYSNSGHTFGDKLSAQDRTAVIEYLKTL